MHHEWDYEGLKELIGLKVNFLRYEILSSNLCQNEYLVHVVGSC